MKTIFAYSLSKSSRAKSLTSKVIIFTPSIYYDINAKELAIGWLFFGIFINFKKK